MIKFEIRVTENEHPTAYIAFDDKHYALLNEFLLAEKGFRREILSAVNEVDLNMSETAGFSGNVFSLEIDKGKTRIINDLTDDELELETADFKEVLLQYIYVLRELKVRERMKNHKHDHGHCHGECDQ